MKAYGVGVLGYGMMGSLHSFSYRVLSMFDQKIPELRLVAIFGRTEENVKVFAEQYGFQKYYTDWRKLINDDRVNVVNVCTPPSEHAEPSILAIEKGKNIICEKPLAATLEDAEKMGEAAESGGARSMVMFNLRFLPAMQYAESLVKNGFLGRVYRFTGSYPKMSHVYPKRYFSWKDVLKTSGGGPLLDLGVHIADLARFLVGDVKEVSATTETYVKERPVKGTNKMKKVETEDTGLSILKFEGGAIGVLESTKVGTGHDESLKIEVNGSNGAIYWSLENPSSLYTFSLSERDFGWKEVTTKNPYPFVSEVWQGHIVGIGRFLKSLEEDEAPEPSFKDGFKAQEIIDAAYRSSKEKKWIGTS